MKGQWMATGLALVLAGPAVAGDDDRAVPRGGSSGGSSSAGASHHSGGGSGSGSSSSHSGSSPGSSSSYTAPPQNDAQRRHPRAGTGTGGRYYNHGGYYYSPYYSPYYYNPYYWNWGLGFSFGYPAYYPGYYGYGYGYPYAPYASGYSGYRVGSVRVMVEPRETRVYVDGYYSGVADDFDGLFQRLNVSSGRHEIALKLVGHRTFKVKVYVPLDQTVKLRHRMEPGTGEETSAEVIGQPDAYAREDGGRDDRDGAEDPDYGEPVAGEEGSLRLLVNPDDASVYVDGDFRGTVRQVRRLRLSPGRHRVELVRPGFRTFEREVDVRPGRESDLQIDLDRS